MWKFDETDYMKRVLSPALDAFKSSGRLPDYFERYDLPLNISDSKEIEKAITTIHGYWNKSKQNPRFNKLLSVVLASKEQQNARCALLDAEARKALREQVEIERKKSREERFAALDRSIEIVASKGFIDPDELKDLVSRFTRDGLTKQDIESRVRVPVRESSVRLPVDEGLPKTIREQIRSSLGVLQKRDLYAFLGMQRGCTRDQLIKGYSACEIEWRPKPSDFNKTAAQLLLGVVKTYMIDGDPAKYETALGYEAVEALRPEVRLAAGDKRITKAEFEQLMAHALSLGLIQTTASEYILTLAKEYGAAVEWNLNEESIRCANCSTQVPLKNKPESCSVCGMGLWVSCPKCSARVPLSDAACTKCGFKTGDLPRVRLLVRRAQIELEEGRIEEAQETAREAERLWDRTGEVAEVLDRVESLIKQASKLRGEIDEALAARLLFTARARLAALAEIAPQYKGRNGKNSSQLKNEVEQGLKECDVLLIKAREHERNGRSDDAIFAYQEALHIAGDAEEARKGLSRCPPKPASNVRARLQDGHVLVEWSASPVIGNIEYIVVRREGRAAVSPADGEAAARVGSTSFLDQKPRAAGHVFYAVFADRGGVLSKPSSSAGLLVMREVSNLSIEAGDKVVKCSWELDVPEARVRIFRKEGSPPSQVGDGREIAPAGPHNFIDREVRNSHLYYYRVAVEYPDANGHSVFTSGLVRSVKPEQPPPAIEDFQITLEQGVLHVSCTPPQQGEVSFYRATDKPEWRTGEQIPTAKLASLGVRLRSDLSSLAVDFAPPQKPVFYVPVTIVGDMAVIGRARRYVATEDVSQLKAQDFGTYLLVQWRWPQDCHLAFVAWRHDAYPQDAQDSRATVQCISKGEYESQGGFRVETPAKAPYYFIVFAASKIGDEYVYSSGVSPGAQDVLRRSLPLSISYSISRNNWLHRNRMTITFSADREARHIPEIVVIAKRGDIQPTRSDQGVILISLSCPSLQPGFAASHEFTLGSVRRPCYLRAFFRDGTAAQGFRLIDPPPQQLKIN